ncbi:unnamed protein product [Ambrosiozyma monospora]|uniref:Unnamed protein product n=1 Tax=Ambrosiozyma monospora TaxID=43982 RepID=A0ACB5U4K3_AMBMO|nr:unnamed protein product [Ambrosiozyma monospora]
MVDSDSVHLALDELDTCSLKDAEKLSIGWSDDVPLKTLNTTGLSTGKPLPPIAQSCSLRSLPGLAYQQSVGRSTSLNSTGSVDSEQTIALSPGTQNRFTDLMMMQAANDSHCEVEDDVYLDKVSVSAPVIEKPGLTQRLKSLEEEESELPELPELEVEMDAGHSSVSSVELEHEHEKSIDIRSNPMNDSDELDLDQNNDEKEDESMDETQHLQLPNNNNNIDPKAYRSRR